MRLLQKWLMRKMRIHLHFAKEKADLWQNIWKINDFCLSVQRERKRFPPAEMKE